MGSSNEMSEQHYYAYGQPQQSNLDFYQQPGFYSAGPLDPAHSAGHDIAGSIAQSRSSTYTGGSIGPVPWWSAFGTGAFEGEPPLLEELGINFDHIRQKSLTVLNPLRPVDAHIMDDADLAGPLVFCFVFAMLLLLSGKPQFSYIYGVALLGSASIYCLLNLMSEGGIDAYRTASVLGYCLLPLVLLSILSIAISLDGTLGYLLSSMTILWCSYAASSIFASVLHLSHQRVLVGYPVALLYSAFALLSVW